MTRPLPLLLEPLRRSARDAPRAWRLAELPPGAALDGPALLAAVDAQAEALRRAGVRAGDRVLLHCCNSAAFAVGVLACWQTDACCALADAGATPPEIDRLVRLLAPAARLGDAAMAPRPGALPCQKIEPEKHGGAPPEHAPGEAVIKITSGTTGEPRGVVVTAGQLLAGGRQILETMGIRPQDANLAAIPLSHSYGFDNLILPLALQGSPLIVLASSLPGELASALALREPCVFPGVPYLFDLLCRSGAYWRPAGLRLCISAGAPLPVPVARAFKGRCGLDIHNFYGTTETGGIAFERLPQADLPEACVGTPLSGVRIDLAPVEGMKLEPGVGRVVVHSAAVAHSCLPRPAGTEGPRDGQFATGDLGRMRPDGRLELVGRLGPLINVGGHKVNPVEVERALRALAGVREAVALAVADARRGEALSACVEAEPGLTRQAILEALAGALPRYKLPRRILLVEELPRTERGKPDVARIRRLLG